MTINLCDRFPALDPFRVREQRFHDVLSVYVALAKIAKKPTDINGKRLEKGAIKVTKKNGDVIIMRPSKDDKHW